MGPLAGGLLEDVGLHAIFVEQVFLGEVEDIELDFLLGVGVGNLEEKPIAVSLGVAVDPHDEVILDWVHVDGQVEVAALEIGVEAEVVLFAGGIGAHEEPVFAHADGEELLGLVVVIEIEVLESSGPIDLGLDGSFCSFGATVVSESLEVGVVTWTHVDHPAGLVVAEGSEGFGDYIDVVVHEDEGELLDFAGLSLLPAE